MLLGDEVIKGYDLKTKTLLEEILQKTASRNHKTNMQWRTLMLDSNEMIEMQNSKTPHCKCILLHSIWYLIHSERIIICF